MHALVFRQWLGVIALTMASGALPAAQILSSITTATIGLDLAGDAWAQESSEEPGEAEQGTPTREGEG